MDVWLIRQDRKPRHTTEGFGLNPGPPTADNKHEMIAETLTSVRELDTRVTDGIHVRLLWSEGDGRLWVSVMDTRKGGSFCLEVGADESAADVFHHPFAYAAHHDVVTSVVDGDSLMTHAV
jgi:hypothetical protein